MLGLFVLGALVFAGVVIFGVLAAVMSLLGFVIALPFRILGWTFKLVGMLLVLPFLLVAGVLTFGFALVPLAPIALVALIVWLIARRPHGSGASVVS